MLELYPFPRWTEINYLPGSWLKSKQAFHLSFERHKTSFDLWNQRITTLALVEESRLWIASKDGHFPAIQLGVGQTQAVGLACQVFVPHRQMRLAPYYCSLYKSHYRSITMGASVGVSDDGFFSAKLFTFSVYVCLPTPVRKCLFVRSNHTYTDQTNCQWPKSELAWFQPHCWAIGNCSEGRYTPPPPPWILLTQVLVAVGQYRCWYAQGCPRGSQEVCTA